VITARGAGTRWPARPPLPGADGSRLCGRFLILASADEQKRLAIAKPILLGISRITTSLGSEWNKSYKMEISFCSICSFLRWIGRTEGRQTCRIDRKGGDGECGDESDRG
jgi:hypothetical protein